MISTVFEDLKELHRNLNVFCSSDPQGDELKKAQRFFIAVDELKRKIKSHQELADQMEEYSKQLDNTVDDVKAIHYKNATLLLNVNVQENSFKQILKQEGASYETLKGLSDNL